MARLAGEIAIITGAGSGMGQAQARLFAREGAKVVVADISPGGKDTANGIGADAAFLQHDVADPASWERLVAFTIEHFGPPSILINTAGIALAPTPVEHTTPADFEKMFRVNLFGVFLGIRAVTPAMVAAGRGAIVNISSVGGIAAAPGYTAYASAKAGLRMLGKVSAMELGPKGIRVNTIFPGATRTAIVTEEQMETFKTYMAPKVALGRMSEPEEVAEATLFLASGAASYITGAELVHDGGFSL